MHLSVMREVCSGHVISATGVQEMVISREEDVGFDRVLAVTCVHLHV